MLKILLMISLLSLLTSCNNNKVKLQKITDEQVTLQEDIKRLKEQLTDSKDKNAKQEEQLTSLKDANVKQAKQLKALKDEGEQWSITNQLVVMEFVLIPAGRFQMGDTQGGGVSDEKPAHSVKIKKDFYMSKTEVTQGQWQSVMDNNRSHFKGTNRPVENVSWNDIQSYIKKLNKLTGKTHRLPSEAQWEYAARVGITGKYSWGNSIDNNRANCDSCGSEWDDKETAPVNSFVPNGFGLYDMHGNVWEWTQDCWNDNYLDAPADGTAWEVGDCAKRVLRGGSWDSDPRWLRSANRHRNATTSRDHAVGFRLIQDRNS